MLAAPLAARHGSLLARQGALRHLDAFSDSSDGSSHGSNTEAPQTSLLVESLSSKWNHYTEPMVVQLIASKADPNSHLVAPWDPILPDFHQTVGCGALHFAARRGLLDVCRALLAHNADPNLQSMAGTTPLMAAVLFGRVEAIQILGEANASVAIEDCNGFAAIDLAILEGRQNIVQMLTDLEVQEVEQGEAQVNEAMARTEADIPTEFAQIMERRRNSKGFGKLGSSKGNFGKLQEDDLTLFSNFSNSQATPRSVQPPMPSSFSGGVMRSIVEDFRESPKAANQIQAAPATPKAAAGRDKARMTLAMKSLKSSHSLGASEAGSQSPPGRASSMAQSGRLGSKALPPLANSQASIATPKGPPRRRPSHAKTVNF